MTITNTVAVTNDFRWAQLESRITALTSRSSAISAAPNRRFATS
jgi:hypothetical protein